MSADLSTEKSWTLSWLTGNKKITLSQRWPRDAPWKLYVIAKSADDCARIATLQSYHYIRWWNYFRCVPTNV